MMSVDTKSFDKKSFDKLDCSVARNRKCIPQNS